MRKRARATRSDDELCPALALALASAPSGISFVYSALDYVVAQGGVGDAVLVVDEPLIGRQVFRARRLPLHRTWASDIALRGAPGLYTDGGSFRPEVVELVRSLCSVALRLDVVGHDAAHDSLTGLLNRRSFDEALLAAVAQSRRYGWPFTLALLDVQGFKSVNDRFGHAVGDLVLRALGSALRAGMRGGDVIARVGGDEFAMVLPNSAPELIPRLAARLERAIETAVPDTGVSLTIGVAQSPADAVDPDELYRLADMRLYSARALR